MTHGQHCYLNTHVLSVPIAALVLGLDALHGGHETKGLDELATPILQGAERGGDKS
jgi:hypothetical protein